VKHRASVVASSPDEIGSFVRAQLEAFLHARRAIVADEFPARIEVLARNIALWGPKVNLTAHPEAPEEVAFHVCDSLMPLLFASDEASPLSGQFDGDDKVLDLGSGAGFPGLVLAAASNAHFTLVESRRKRGSFLHVAVAEMGLKNVTVEARRAEQVDLGHYDLVTARAFGDADKLVTLAMRALKPRGLAILYASPAQRFSFEVMSISYHLMRRDERVDRVLAIWKRP